ncbi:hypothetical protein Bca52824_051377 [Brassica carinata]|uniref:F-box domain-containing protein n=1 Tax=Brassica carinata TaxID=52824 RepID=A0A8X7UIL9_BRACI|nr:hypothetical protein Bca52824_051377 [Brassica carinata]
MYDEYRARYLRAREDTISKLPDPLLCQILSHLPTKDAFRTSVLSHRWRSVCLLVPNLDLDSSEFPDYDTFVSFIDKLLAFSREENSVLYKVKLSLQKEDENNQYCVTRWIDSVANTKLNHLDVECILVNRDGFVDVFEREGSGVFIDAPRLKYLKFEDDLSDVKVITNSMSLEKVNVAFVFGENDFAHVIDLPKRNMFLDYNWVCESYDPLPQFCNVSTLKVKFSVLNLDMMMSTLLESFPNLNSLVLKLDDPSNEKAANVRLSSVPPCLLSSLEFVKIKRFNGGPVDMEIARYFLEKSQVLKKLVLDFKCSAFEQGFYMLRDLIALPRRSSSSQIPFLHALELKGHNFEWYKFEGNMHM